ncbi:MAG: lipopolysaccharide biosynthesis protein [Thiomonas sp.]
MSRSDRAVWRLWRWRPGGLARDGARIFLGLGLRAAAQAALVLLLARWLGAQGYGAFVAALAMATFFTPLAGLGLAAVIVRDGSGGPSALARLRRGALRLWAAASLASTALAVGAIAWSLPAPAPLAALALLAAGEVAAASLVEINARIEQARQRAMRFGLVMAGLPLARLLGLLVLLLAASPPSPAAWMIAYGLSSVAYAALLTVLQGAGWRHSRVSPPPPAGHLARDGLPFAAGALASRLQTEFNKPVLAHLSYADAGGFNVAQRLVDLVTLPLAALQEALWPRVFAAPDPHARMRRSAAALLAVALAAAAVLVLFAPILTWLLGGDYAPAAHALAALALLPALQVARNLGNAWLMAHGKSQVLLLVSAAAAAAGVLLVLLLVPRYGMMGAVWAAYASEAVAIVVQAAVARQVKRLSR